MTLEFICKGYHKKTYEETTYSIEISAENDYPDYFRELLRTGKFNASNSNETINIALRELSWFKNLIYKEVISVNEKCNYAYLVMLDWLTPDDHDTDYYHFKTYADALDKFNSVISDECDADISWVGSEVFDENGEVNEGFELRCNTATDDNNERDLYWNVSDKDKFRYSSITLTKIKIL